MSLIAEIFRKTSFGEWVAIIGSLLFVAQAILLFYKASRIYNLHLYKEGDVVSGKIYRKIWFFIPVSSLQIVGAEAFLEGERTESYERPHLILLTGKGEFEYRQTKTSDKKEYLQEIESLNKIIQDIRYGHITEFKENNYKRASISFANCLIGHALFVGIMYWCLKNNVGTH